MNTVRKFELGQDFDKFFRYWGIAIDIVQKDNGAVSERLLAAWSKAICCIAPEDVPPDYIQKYQFVRAELMQYRFSARWSGDAAWTIPTETAESIANVLLEPVETLARI